MFICDAPPPLLLQPPMLWMWIRDHTLEVPTLKFHSLAAPRQKPPHVAAATCTLLCWRRRTVWLPCLFPPWGDMNEGRQFSKELTNVDRLLPG